jgi:hypothetical protein
VDVQVVSGLIEEKDLRFTEDDLSDGYSHSPASREVLGSDTQVSLLEAETSEDLDSLRLCLLGLYLN